MTSSSSSFFQQQTVSMNTHQQTALRSFSSEGLTAADFSGRDWFNSYYHDRTFTFLVNKKKCSFKEAFSILDKLDNDQAYGILQGLSREEVVDLNKYQIDVVLKYGLSKDEVFGLDQYQRQVLLALRNDGIKSDYLRSQNWINSYDHAVALLYLIRVKKKSTIEACDYLKDLNLNEARAISYGIDKSEVKGLEIDAISLLIVGRKHDGLRSREEVEGLNVNQIEMVKKLYHFGLTSQMIRDQIKQTGSNIHNSLSCLVLERGIPIKNVLTMISGLNNYQIYGLSEGLNPKDMTGLNEYQIRALATCRTIKNGLTAEDLRDKSWFDSENHVSALNHMLLWGEFTVKEAMQELDGLTGDQAKQVSEGRKRDDIVDLTKFQLKALDKFGLGCRGLTGSHLRGKDWFNSANHVAALEHLIGKKYMTIEDAMNQLDGLSAEQVNLFISENILRDIIIKLTPMQITIFHNKYEYGFYGSNSELLDATWLNMTEHVDLLKVLYRELHNSTKALAIVKDASDKGQVKETLEKIQNGWISGETLRFNIDHQLYKQQSSSQSNSRSSGCKMM